MFRTLSALAAALILALPVHALPPLSQNDYVNDRIFGAAVGDAIRKNCPTISARMIYAVGQAMALERYALKQGYTKDQIDAYIESPTEKQKMEARRDTYLTQNGVVAGQPDTYCALGLSEIEKNTIAGTLLRAR